MVTKINGWIGVSFDRTLATYDSWKGPAVCGAPIPATIDRVKAWLADGRDVRIFTPRIAPFATVIRNEKDLELLAVKGEKELAAVQSVLAIRAWSNKHLGRYLPVTNVIDYGFSCLYSADVVAIKPNTGEEVH